MPRSCAASSWRAGRSLGSATPTWCLSTTAGGSPAVPTWCGACSREGASPTPTSVTASARRGSPGSATRCDRRSTSLIMPASSTGRSSRWTCSSTNMGPPISPTSTSVAATRPRPTTTDRSIDSSTHWSAPRSTRSHRRRPGSATRIAAWPPSGRATSTSSSAGTDWSTRRSTRSSATAPRSLWVPRAAASRAWYGPASSRPWPPASWRGRRTGSSSPWCPVRTPSPSWRQRCYGLPCTRRQGCSTSSAIPDSHSPARSSGCSPRQRRRRCSSSISSRSCSR